MEGANASQVCFPMTPPISLPHREGPVFCEQGICYPPSWPEKCLEEMHFSDPVGREQILS